MRHGLGIDFPGFVNALITAVYFQVIPQQEDEFTCMNCFLVKHRSQIAEESGPGFICLECAA